MASQMLSQATPADPDPDDAATLETFLGRIYRISAPTCDRVYVGSTRTTLAARLGRHRRDLRGYKRGTYHYISSFEVLDVTIDLLEEAEYHDMQQFREREAYWIQRLPSCNRTMPGRSPQTSSKISKSITVYCSTCGRFVRRGVLSDHRLTRACMMAAFKRSSSSSSERKRQSQPCSQPSTPSLLSCPTSPSSSLPSLL